MPRRRQQGRGLAEADCYVFHPLNAYTEDGRIIADVARYARLPLFGEEAASGIDEESGARLTRWTLDLAGGGVKEARLDDLPLEVARLDERHAGLRHRHGYAAGIVGENGGSANFNAIVHVDLETGRRRTTGSRRELRGRADLRAAERGLAGRRGLPPGARLPRGGAPQRSPRARRRERRRRADRQR
jgi:carotenoid cleavage dioxygenase-like enzyme